MVLMAGLELPLRAVREQVARALDLVVQVERRPGGRRRVSCISEVCGLDDGTLLTQDIFALGPDGQLRPRGLMPSFLDARGMRDFVQRL